MTPAFLQRGIAAGILSALIVIGTGPAAQAQSQRSTQPSTRSTPAKPAPAPAAKPATKPAPTVRTNAAKPAAAGVAAGAAATAARPAQAATGPGGASLLTSYGDWGVYTAQTGRSKICYALSQPQERQPKDIKRDPGYIFVSFRPAENVKNEVAFNFGFSAKKDGQAQAAVGTTSYALLSTSCPGTPNLSCAWLKNPAEEGQAIATMARSGSLTVKMQSARGSSLTDRYSLNGFGKALEHARKECAS